MIQLHAKKTLKKSARFFWREASIESIFASIKQFITDIHFSRSDVSTYGVHHLLCYCRNLRHFDKNFLVSVS